MLLSIPTITNLAKFLSVFDPSLNLIGVRTFSQFGRQTYFQLASWMLANFDAILNPGSAHAIHWIPLWVSWPCPCLLRCLRVSSPLISSAPPPWGPPTTSPPSTPPPPSTISPGGASDWDTTCSQRRRYDFCFPLMRLPSGCMSTPCKWMGVRVSRFVAICSPDHPNSTDFVFLKRLTLVYGWVCGP